MIAKADIAKGDEITTQYVPSTSKGTFCRRKELKNMWCFDCSCSLCKDPTEFGTMFSALKCPVCETDDNGLLQKNPLDEHSDWACKTCQFTKNSVEVCSQNDEIETTLEAAIQQHKFAKEEDGGDLPELKQLLLEVEEHLHGHHYLVIKLKQKIALLLGHNKVDGGSKNELSTVSTDLLKQKLSLCQEVVGVKSKLDNGTNSKWRIALENEINHCLAELTKRTD